MAVSNPLPSRATPLPPPSRTTVVPLRPKPPTFPAVSAVTRPIIIEEDVVEYLVKASLEQRWKILSRVAAATAVATTAATEEPAPSASSAPPAAGSAVDHSEELFRAMQELMRLDGAPEGARFCLDAALRSVPCMAGLALLRDRAMGDMSVVHARGPRADRLLRTRSQVDALMTRAGRARKPTVVTYGAEPGAEKAMCPRHALFDPWSVVLVPVMHDGALVGLLELIDPIDGNPFDDQALSALAYVGSRLGRFLAERAADTGASTG
jgi:hypothetical protein